VVKNRKTLRNEGRMIKRIKGKTESGRDVGGGA
jgi:hypothetical protein